MLLHDLVNAVIERAQDLIKARVEETKIGVEEDKVKKIKMASLAIYQFLARHPAAGKLDVGLSILSLK